MRKIKEVDVEALSPSPECSAETVRKVKMALPEVGLIALSQVDRFSVFTVCFMTC